MHEPESEKPVRAALAGGSGTCVCLSTFRRAPRLERAARAYLLLPSFSRPLQLRRQTNAPAIALEERSSHSVQERGPFKFPTHTRTENLSIDTTHTTARRSPPICPISRPRPGEDVVIVVTSACYGGLGCCAAQRSRQRARLSAQMFASSATQIITSLCCHLALPVPLPSLLARRHR